MKAVVYETFGTLPVLKTVADPTPTSHGVVIEVGATGLCRSDWHGWMGHDADIELPHVPGHELAGTIVAIGKDVTRWNVGDRVTVPFVGGCGSCSECHAGHHQVCDNQFQPGFTHWGSFAQFVSIHFADTNLVALKPSIDFATAASLGCRFATAFRAIVDQAKTAPGEWVAVHGCGGVGLSAIMIAKALGANVIAVDISKAALKLATQLGATHTINASDENDVIQAVRDLTGGGAHVSIDALGNPKTCFNSIASLRKRGRHVQVGLMLAEHSRPVIPMDQIIAHELEIYGSHGMQAYRYDAMLAMIEAGTLSPSQLVGKHISLAQSAEALTRMDQFESSGVTVITEF